MEDSIWKFACLRDLQVLPPRHVSFSWLQLYKSAFDGSHLYSARQKEKHIDWMRIGAFYFESPIAFLSENLCMPRRLPSIEDDPEKWIQSSGSCLLTNIRTGIWIADLHLVRCPVCNLNTCEGTMQILEARHAELFLEEGYNNGSWDYKDIGSRRIEKSCTSAARVIQISSISTLFAPKIISGKSYCKASLPRQVLEPQMFADKWLSMLKDGV